MTLTASPLASLAMRVLEDWNPGTPDNPVLIAVHAHPERPTLIPGTWTSLWLPEQKMSDLTHLIAAVTCSISHVTAPLTPALTGYALCWGGPGLETENPDHTRAVLDNGIGDLTPVTSTIVGVATETGELTCAFRDSREPEHLRAVAISRADLGTRAVGPFADALDAVAAAALDIPRHRR